MDNPYCRGLQKHEDRAIGAGRRRRPMSCLIPALLVLVAAPVPAAGPNLFTTPEQRERLDRIRAEATAEELAREPEPEPTPEQETAAAPNPPPRVHLRGFVRRSKGPSAVWVNSGNTLQGAAVGDDLNAGRVEGATVVVTLPDGKQVRLKPGQTWDPESGEVVDVQGD